MDANGTTNGTHTTAIGSSPTTAAASTLPPEAIALASRMFDAARTGQMDIFEQALPRGLPANMTNDKGDSLVGILPSTFALKASPNSWAR